MNNKFKFLIALFYNRNINLINFPLFITLIFNISIYLLPKFNYTIYLFLIIILNILNYLFITTLFKKVKTYLKSLNFNFLEFNFLYYFFLNFFLFLSIIEKMPKIKEKILSYFDLPFLGLLPLLIFYSILFFLQLFITYKEVKLSELENYDELVSKFYNDPMFSFYKSFFSRLYLIWFFIYLLFSSFKFYSNNSLTYLFAFFINPTVTILCVISLIEATTYYVRKALLELKKLQKDNTDELIKH